MKTKPSVSQLLTAIAIVAVSHSPAAGAADVTPPADLANWTCVGNCGSLPQTGDIALSPLGNSKYGYVSTADSAASNVSPLGLSDNKVGAETNGSKFLSGIFGAGQNDKLNVYFNYASTDGNGYDDYSWARVVDADSNNSLVAWVFTARSTNSGSNKIIPGDVVRNDEFDASSMITNYQDYQFTAKTIDWAPLGFSNSTCWEEDAKGCGFTGWLQSSLTFEKAGNYRLEVGVTNWGDTAYDSGLAFDYAHLTDTRISAAVPEPQTYLMMLAGLLAVGYSARNRLRPTRA